jgi:hypothetical protein
MRAERFGIAIESVVDVMASYLDSPVFSVNEPPDRVGAGQR